MQGEAGLNWAHRMNFMPPYRREHARSVERGSQVAFAFASFPDRFVFGLDKTSKRTAKACCGENAAEHHECSHARRFSAVRFHYKISKIARFPRYFRSETGGFLRSPDCVAERSGFEPSIRITNEKSRNHGQISEIFGRKLAQRKIGVWGGTF